MTVAAATPVGTINVVDPSPLNWLFITWNTMEEPIRIDEDGRTVFALAESADWRDERTLELTLRRGVRFQDGEPFTAHAVKLNFDEYAALGGAAPAGYVGELPAESVAEVVDDHTVRFHFPGPDGLAVGKMRGFHIASTAFWKALMPPGSATRSSVPAKAIGE